MDKKENMNKGKIMEKENCMEQVNNCVKTYSFKTYNSENYEEVLSKVMGLQEIIFESLKPDQKDFILKKTEEKYKENFNNKDVIFACAFCGDELVATTMTKPSPDDHKPTKIKDEKLNDFTILECSNGMVHPKHQGHGLLSKLLEKIIVHYTNIKEYEDVEKKFEKVEKKFLLTGEIVYTNCPSLISTLKSGFAIDHAGNSSEDNAEVVYLLYAVNSSFDKNLLKEGTSIKELTKEEIKTQSEDEKNYKFYTEAKELMVLENANKLMVLKQQMPQQNAMYK